MVSGALQLSEEKQLLPDFCEPCPPSHLLSFYFCFYQAQRYQVCLLIFMFFFFNSGGLPVSIKRHLSVIHHLNACHLQSTHVINKNRVCFLALPLLSILGLTLSGSVT